jgi:hypothetical protein
MPEVAAGVALGPLAASLPAVRLERVICTRMALAALVLWSLTEQIHLDKNSNQRSHHVQVTSTNASGNNEVLCDVSLFFEDLGDGGQDELPLHDLVALELELGYFVHELDLQARLQNRVKKGAKDTVNVERGHTEQSKTRGN